MIDHYTPAQLIGVIVAAALLISLTVYLATLEGKPFNQWRKRNDI